MSSPKDASKDKLSRVVKFAPVEADQVLWQAVEKTLSEQSQSSFSELCKQALYQYLVAQSATVAVPAAEVSTLQRQVVALQKQIRALQLQVAKLEGAIGMQQTLSLSAIEKQLHLLEQRMTQQTDQLTDRLSQLESQAEGTSPAPAVSEPVGSVEPVELDPLLSRLVPLLEDF